ncbi:hypothetical protein BDC45DRAFT_538096 [Circinella umbellata]|nr:hypothetical protein BDC45DRAFT_538096 [Circinella umbellata]
MIDEYAQISLYSVDFNICLSLYLALLLLIHIGKIDTMTECLLDRDRVSGLLKYYKFQKSVRHICDGLLRVSSKSLFKLVSMLFFLLRKLSLSANERCREDVKPYSTFIKKISICQQIIFENASNSFKGGPYLTQTKNVKDILELEHEQAKLVEYMTFSCSHLCGPKLFASLRVRLFEAMVWRLVGGKPLNSLVKL